MGMVELSLICIVGIVLLVLVAGGIGAVIYFNNKKQAVQKTCSACGALNPADHKFCGQCGKPLE
ncbi:MAG TPA: zinc-ribbon domain-containing protein [Anaerolineales bacterium]|nr:zinc-ribbon domain-containing protein [Anaerolineales bacterium]